MLNCCTCILQPYQGRSYDTATAFMHLLCLWRRHYVTCNMPMSEICLLRRHHVTLNMIMSSKCVLRRHHVTLNMLMSCMTSATYTPLYWMINIAFSDSPYNEKHKTCYVLLCTLWKKNKIMQMKSGPYDTTHSKLMIATFGPLTRLYVLHDMPLSSVFSYVTQRNNISVSVGTSAEMSPCLIKRFRWCLSKYFLRSLNSQTYRFCTYSTQEKLTGSPVESPTLSSFSRSPEVARLPACLWLLRSC